MDAPRLPFPPRASLAPPPSSRAHSPPPSTRRYFAYRIGGYTLLLLVPLPLPPAGLQETLRLLASTLDSSPPPPHSPGPRALPPGTGVRYSNSLDGNTAATEGCPTPLALSALAEHRSFYQRVGGVGGGRTVAGRGVGGRKLAVEVRGEGKGFIEREIGGGVFI